MKKYYDENGEGYYGLPTLPADGWDEVRQPFIGHECNWETERNKRGRNTNLDGRRAYTPSGFEKTMQTLQDNNRRQNLVSR